MDQAIKPRG